MSQTLLLEQNIQLSTPPKQSNKTQHLFLKELIKIIRQDNSCHQYNCLPDESLINELITTLNYQNINSKNLNLNPLNQLLTDAFYRAIGKTIEHKTGHITEIYVHVRNKEFSSAVIFCGGVLVLNSLISGYENFRFTSLQELVAIAENYIHKAVIKANCYLDF